MSANKQIEEPKDLYKLMFHQTADISNWINVMRVPGGWIYLFSCPVSEGTDYGVFVPFDNEYQEQALKA